MKRNYTKPEIVRIDVQDRSMLAMAVCKSELPEVNNCCYEGSGCATDPTRGGEGGILRITPAMEINNS